MPVSVSFPIRCTPLQVLTQILALIYYDYALTFGWEVQYMWGTRFRPSTLFYICARYSLFVNILFLVSIIDKTSPKVHIFSLLEHSASYMLL